MMAVSTQNNQCNIIPRTNIIMNDFHKAILKNILKSHASIRVPIKSFKANPAILAE